jgi:hypothetical protein
LLWLLKPVIRGGSGLNALPLGYVLPLACVCVALCSSDHPRPSLTEMCVLLKLSKKSLITEITPLTLITLLT